MADKKLVIGSVLVLVFLFLIGGFAIKMPYTAMVTYTAKEPYETQECRNVPYQVTDEVPLGYIIVDSNAGKEFNIFGFRGWVEIKNTDDKPGTFTIHCTYDIAGTDQYSTGRGYIEPGEIKRIFCEKELSWFTQVRFSYTITPGTKSVVRTEYREECTTVTKWREVEEQRAETKYHSLFESLGLI